MHVNHVFVLLRNVSQLLTVSMMGKVHVVASMLNSLDQMKLKTLEWALLIHRHQLSHHCHPNSNLAAMRESHGGECQGDVVSKPMSQCVDEMQMDDFALVSKVQEQQTHFPV